MPVDVKYRTTATATGGRDGHAATKDGALDVQLSTPKELAGAAGRVTIPSSCSPPATPPVSWER